MLPEEVAHKHLQTKRCPGHAQEFETAFALAAFPENVRHDAMHDQEDKEPLLATAAAGAAMIEVIVEEVTQFVAGMIDGTNVAEIPPFQP
jgi:creatinine amidohydrolase/Fe(II)-dependent formamide hydrolase-like protein